MAIRELSALLFLATTDWASLGLFNDRGCASRQPKTASTRSACALGT
jgi:hypothetical protein